MVRAATLLERGDERHVMYGLIVNLTVRGPAGSLADHVDQVTEQLVGLEDCTPELLDSAIGLEISTGSVDVDITVDTDLPEDALRIGLSCLRTAIHAAGGGTPDWDAADHDEHVVLYLLDTDEGMQVRPLVPVSA